MGRDSLGAITGLAVLVTGVVAAVSLIGPAGESAVELPAAPATSVTQPEPVAATVGELPGVGPSVTRVLLWGGDVRFADTADLTQLPASVTAVLIEYGLPLTVPTTPEAMK